MLCALMSTMHFKLGLDLASMAFAVHHSKPFQKERYKYHMHRLESLWDPSARRIRQQIGSKLDLETYRGHTRMVKA